MKRPGGVARPGPGPSERCLHGQPASSRPANARKLVAVNANTSRRSFLTGTIGAGLGAVTEPATNQHLDLDWAEFRLAELRVAHADGADTASAFADLAARIRDATYQHGWGPTDHPRILRLA